MVFNVEFTDTFGGQANYAWVRRETINLRDDTPTRNVVRAAKRALGLTGIRCDVCEVGEVIEIRPRRRNVVAFVTWTTEEATS